MPKYTVTVLITIVVSKLALAALPSKAFAQDTASKKNELHIFIKGAYNINKPFFENPDNFTTCNNTFSASGELNYTRVIAARFLIAAGMEVGYDRYSFELNEPFNRPNTSLYTAGGSQDIHVSVAYLRPNISIGYRAKKTRGIVPEFRLVQACNIPLSAYDVTYRKIAPPGNIEFSRTGYLGKYLQNDISLELLTGAMALTHIDYNLANKKRTLTLGLQTMRRVIMGNSSTGGNAFHTRYLVNGKVAGTDKFFNKHQTASIVIGFDL